MRRSSAPSHRGPWVLVPFAGALLLSTVEAEIVTTARRGVCLLNRAGRAAVHFSCTGQPELTSASPSLLNNPLGGARLLRALHKGYFAPPAYPRLSHKAGAWTGPRYGRARRSMARTSSRVRAGLSVAAQLASRSRACWEALAASAVKMFKVSPLSPARGRAS